MVDVRGDVLRPPHGTTPAAVKSNKRLLRTVIDHENQMDIDSHGQIDYRNLVHF